VGGPASHAKCWLILKMQVPSKRFVLFDFSLWRGIPHGSVVAIHDLAKVSDRFPARLFVCPKAATIDATSRDFVCRLSENEYSDLDSKLQALESVIAGHQYFPLSGTSATLMVSVGEYSDQWWQQNA
jgi:hypothetical protein